VTNQDELAEIKLAYQTDREVTGLQIAWLIDEVERLRELKHFLATELNVTGLIQKYGKFKND